MPTKLPTEDQNERNTALARYLEVRGGGPTDPKVTKLKPKKTTADYNATRNLKNQTAAAERASQKADEKRRCQVARTTGRIDAMLTRFHQQPLAEVTPPAYDVSKVDRNQNKPPVFAPLRALVRNVQKPIADQLGDNGIEPADFKTWREQHLEMTVDQLAALIRVAGRTIRMWESGKSRIPFAMYWVMKQLQPSDLPAGFDESKPTRYVRPVMADNGALMLNNVLRRHAFAMKEQGITAMEFKQWRLSTMLMSPEQLAQMVRVPVKTVMDWESGKTAIPFSMWWVMHTTLQDPEVFLTRPGFHNFYIDYHDGEPMICSRTHPDIRYTITDLYAGRVAMSGIETMHRELQNAARRNDELAAENTRLRQMLKAGVVEAQLVEMHAHIGTLLKQIHTADVLAFPDVETTSEIIQPLRQASA